MERRGAIKSMAVAVAGVVFLPGCNFSSESKEVANSFLSPDQDQLLAEIVESIIPATENVPGAKALRVHDYIKLMVADCHEIEIHNIFLKGLGTVEKLAKDTYGKSYADLEQQQKIELLTTMKEADNEEYINLKTDNSLYKEHNNQFYSLVKGLTIQGYMTSEYIMVNHSDYVMVPGSEYGCIPVSSKQTI